MPERIVVDSGPCIALFNRDDEYHEQAVQFVRDIRAELVSLRWSIGLPRSESVRWIMRAKCRTDC